MSPSWWKRLLGRSGRPEPVTDRHHGIVFPGPWPADVRMSDADAEPARTTGADTAAAPHPATEATGAAPPEPARGLGVAPTVPRASATYESVSRSLHWRVGVLLDGLPAEVLRSDGPAFARMLLEGREAFISQLPAAARRALVVSRQPDAGMAEIVALFENDPMLTQSLLRMANSAYYRRGESPVVSIRDAASRVGLRAVQSVLVSSMVEGLLCRPGGEYDALVRMTWEHMQRTAPIARGIAPAFGLDPETAYSLALLHDAGKLVLFDQLSSHRRRLRREVRITRPFMDAMLLHLHEPMGALAMLRWELGGEAAHAVGDHHRRSRITAPDAGSEVLCVAEAIDIARARGQAFDGEELWRRAAIHAVREDVLARVPESPAEDEDRQHPGGAAAA